MGNAKKKKEQRAAGRANGKNGRGGKGKGRDNKSKGRDLQVIDLDSLKQAIRIRGIKTCPGDGCHRSADDASRVQVRNAHKKSQVLTVCHCKCGCYFR